MADKEPEAVPKYIASVRTALSDPRSAIYREIPGNYMQSSVKDVLGYMLSDKQKADELATASSVKKAMANRSGYTVTVGERTVAEDESIAGLFTEADHEGVKYQALDMEVATNQEG